MCAMLGITACAVQKTEHAQILPEAWEGGGEALGSSNWNTGGGVSLAGTSRRQGRVDTFWASANLALKPLSTARDMDTLTHSQGYCLL